MSYLFFVLGLVGLFAGGEFLVRGSVSVAHRLHVPQLIVGLTIVGFGTSMPELLVSLQAARAGAPGLAIGNVVGSNIANILLILGATAIVRRVPMVLGALGRDFAVAAGATLALWVMLLGPVISRLEGVLLLLVLAAFLGLSFRAATSDASRSAARAAAEEAGDSATERPLWRSGAEALGGLLVLMLGARLLVMGATDIARDYGVSEAVIGLTIVAIGTSLPELVACVMAALRGHSGIAVGNILGSCIFNILAIIGITALVAPIPVDPGFAARDMVVAAAALAAMVAFAAVRGAIGRKGGAALLVGYAGYMVLLTGG